MLRRLLILLMIVVPCCLQAQQPNPTIDVQRYSFSIGLNDSNNIIKGKAAIRLTFLQDVQTLQLDLVQRKANDSGMVVDRVLQGMNDVSFSQDSQHVFISTPAKAGDMFIYTIYYHGRPADGLIIATNEFGHRTFFADNWPNRAHNWIPCNDHLSDKATVEFIVTAPDHYQVVANGVKKEETNQPNHFKLTRWEENTELPTKVMVIGVADFAVNYVGDAGAIPVYTWVYPESRDTGFATYAQAKNILSFFVNRIGPYSFEKLANVQSKTIFGGMENAGAIFYFEKSVANKGLEGLMAHEIAHQWFGDAATEKNWQHLWLSEGFATYMANIYHESKYGVDSFNHRLIDDRKKVVAFSKKRHTPVVDTSYGKNLMQLLNANSYEKGGWVLHMLRRKLGDTIFWKSIREYYSEYRGRNASTEDLQKVFEAISNEDLSTFFKQWLYTPGQPDLAIEWKYDKAKSIVTVAVTQQQSTLFEFPLEIAVSKNDIPKTFAIKDKVTTFDIPSSAKPDSLLIDPNVNLLYEGIVREKK